MECFSYRFALLVTSLALFNACSTDEKTHDDLAIDASSVFPGAANGGPGAAMQADAGSPGLVPTDSATNPLPMDGGTHASASDTGTSTPSASDAASSDAGPSAADAAANAEGGAQAPLSDYTKRGPYKVKQLLNQGMGTIANGDSALLPLTSNNDPSALTVYFPENAAAGERFPLLTFGNGTFCSPTFYDELIDHVVSHGFIVIAANTSTVGTGEPMIKALDWALAQNTQAQSPLNGKIDPERLGAFGHSQGGAGTCNAGLDPRIDTIVPLSGVPLNEDAGTGTISKIKIPVFFVTTADEASGSTLIEDSFNAAKAPAAYGVTISGNHDEYTDAVDDPGVPGLTSNDAKNSRAGVVAWFEWQLKNKSAAHSLFVGASCGFCSGSTWKSMKSRGL